MAVQVPPTLARMATPSGVALVRLVNNSTSVLPVTTAMALPPQLNGRVAGTASIPPAGEENVHRKRASKTGIEKREMVCSLWAPRRRDVSTECPSLRGRGMAGQQVAPPGRREVAEVAHRKVPLPPQ